MGARFSTALVCAAWALCGAAQAQDIQLTAPEADAVLTDRLRAASLLLQDTEDTRTAQDLIAAARADYGRLVAALYDAGYFTPVVRITADGREVARISPFAAPRTINQVTIQVDPGPAFRLGTAEIAPLASGTELPDEFRPGGDASTRLLRDTASAAITGWRNVGYATAEVGSQQITARAPQAILDVRVQIEPGQVVQFGTLIPRGQERMREERILAIAGLPEGERFSPDTLDRVEGRLQDTGVFSAINLQEGEVGPDGVMNIEATLVENEPRRFGFGAEISTDDGATVSAYWLHRNLFGGAERLRIEGEISGIGSEGLEFDTIEEVEGIDASVGLRFSRPATFTPDTTAYAELGADYLDEPAFSMTTIGAEFGVEHRFDRRLTGTLGVGLDYYDIDDEFGERQITALSVPVGLTWDRREDPLDARELFYINGTATPFLTDQGSGGARLYADGRIYIGFGEDRASRIALRGQLGSVVGGDITDIPPNYLFYSGGAGTVRGHDFQSLGATQDGVESGGRSFAGLATEFRQDIGETDFGVVAFLDTGFIGADPMGGDGEWHAGAGLGVRYDTAFGPIRVDLATPVRGEGVGEDLHIYIGIGHAF
ncbi:autotransporter assembly complex protein TamA [Gymnodinialimonas ceratoperidinii]|uniref:Autotransporter assembly complex protein TamA n=1 Tax=Gymnodinialimonas ceratoperidinii TaxID=2856823 RepID=A0A8F6TX41_9RHOB|nr:autotransporter assembly complex family protein [Gymnodinialimonas ceratoperidinii]QXT40048.1 autotransporter assembly complex protein TamA [Gymnodinialimonas ceratoperidinii]